MKTNVYTDYGEEVVSYVLNSGLSYDAYSKLKPIKRKLENTYSKNITTYSKNELHVTLMDWLAPFVDYGGYNDKTFKRIRNRYERTLEHILSRQRPITVNFKDIKVSKNAIFVLGQDDGSFARIRGRFTGAIKLLPGTKQPPEIVHFTIARYNSPVDMEELENIVKTFDFTHREVVDKFRLVRETKVPMLEYKVVREFHLK